MSETVKAILRNLNKEGLDTSKDTTVFKLVTCIIAGLNEAPTRTRPKFYGHEDQESIEDFLNGYIRVYVAEENSAMVHAITELLNVLVK